MEYRYHATTQNRFYPDMSNVNKNITVGSKTYQPTYVFLSDFNQLWTFSTEFSYRTMPVKSVKCQPRCYIRQDDHTANRRFWRLREKRLKIQGGGKGGWSSPATPQAPDFLSVHQGTLPYVSKSKGHPVYMLFYIHGSVHRESN